MISLYKSDDYSIICEIWEKSVRATHDFLSAEDREFYKSLVSKYFPKTIIYTFEEEGFVKGFLGVDDQNINMLFVSPDYIGQGVGKVLLLYAMEELGLSQVDVNEQNTHAFCFYTHFGFKVVSRDELDGFGKPYPILHLKKF